MHGGKYGLEEEKSQGVNCMEVSIQGFLYLYTSCRKAKCVCTWLQEGESHMYIGCSGHNHIYVGCSGEKCICTQVAVRRITYIVFWEGAGLYRLTGDIIRSYRWSATDLWAEEVSSKLLRFGFLICMVIGGQGCPHILVIFVLAERTRLSSYLVILY
jgi:hypothetical protein